MTIEMGQIGPPADGTASDQHDVRAKKRRRRLAVLSFLILLLLTLLLSGIWYQCTRWEGPRSFLAEQAGITTPHYLYSIYGVDEPQGVSVSPDGRIFVTESAGERLVKIFDQDGNPLGELSPPGSASPNRKPLYVALAADGRIFVSDLLRRKVDIYAADGTYMDFLRPDGQEDYAWTPAAMDFDELGNLYVTDLSEHRILIIDPEGNVVRIFAGAGSGMGRFAFPNGIEVRGDRTYVADSNNSRVLVMDNEGDVITVIVVGKDHVPLGLPRGIAVTDDALYVVDAFEHAVQVFDPENGGFKFSYGSPGIGDGEFAYPNGLAIDGVNFYVTDRENGRVQVWTY